MDAKEFSATDVVNGSIVSCFEDPARSRVLPGPEEGWELIRAFTKIRNAALRRAVLKMVQTLSASQR
jgi:hypothetical protein